MERFLNPEQVLKELKIKKNMIAADFGSGSGGWAIPLAKKLEEGKVFAVDILEEPLESLKEKMRFNKISNIETVRADVEKGTRLLKESCDLVLMTNLLFESEEKMAIMEEGKRVLKKGGKILVVDWKEEAEVGPEKRVSVQEIKEMAEKLNLKLEKEFKAGPWHYGLILIK